MALQHTRLSRYLSIPKVAYIYIPYGFDFNGTNASFTSTSSVATDGDHGDGKTAAMDEDEIEDAHAIVSDSGKEGDDIDSVVF